MMAIVQTIHLSNIGLYVLALIYGMYGAAVRSRDGATSVVFLILAVVSVILGEVTR